MTPGEQDVTVDGLRFRCRVDGRDGTPWMVFSNSLATDLSLWDAQVASFGDRFRILRYDQRGHGGTEVPSAPATLDQLTEDAAALMAAFGISGATVVGASMGAATALSLAARFPDRVARVVASDGQAATALGGAEAWQERIGLASRRGMAAFADVTVGRWFSAASRDAANDAIPKIRAMIAATPLAGFVACARALQHYDIRAQLAAIRQPTLLIAGAEDGRMPQAMCAIRDRIPGSRFVAIVGTGHLPCIEGPVAFDALLSEFLEDT